MQHHYTVLHEGEEHPIIIEQKDNGYQVMLGEEQHHFELLLGTTTLCSFQIDGSKILEADTKFNQDKCELFVSNVPYHLEVFDPRRRKASQSGASGGDGLVSAPMPGKIVDVLVAKGDTVKSGQALAIIEAMKMQNELTSPLDGTVAEVRVTAGDTVEADAKLVVVKKD